MYTTQQNQPTHQGNWVNGWISAIQVAYKCLSLYKYYTTVGCSLRSAILNLFSYRSRREVPGLLRPWSIGGSEDVCETSAGGGMYSAASFASSSSLRRDADLMGIILGLQIASLKPTRSEKTSPCFGTISLSWRKGERLEDAEIRGYLGNKVRLRLRHLRRAIS